MELEELLKILNLLSRASKNWHGYNDEEAPAELDILYPTNDNFFSWSPEECHKKADSLLLEYINQPEVTEAFGDITKWYS